MPWESAITGAGVTIVAALGVAGFVLLRYQRDRNHFQLMKAAIDKGITAFPGTTPGWLISLRIGVLTVVLGAGLFVAGVVAIKTAPELPLPQVRADYSPPAPPQAPAETRMGPDGRPEPSRAEAPPPREPPELERWHRAEDQRALGLAGLCAGGILALLGIVRIVFAGLERRYTNDVPPR